MSIDQRSLMLLHAVVRGVLLNSGLEPGYGLIFRSILPFVAKCDQKPALTIRKLQHIATTLYIWDKAATFTSSCLSISILIQILCFWCELPSELRIGLRKEDGKLLGHAWVECQVDGRVIAINPGTVEPSAYRVTQILEPRAAIIGWVENT